MHLNSLNMLYFQRKKTLLLEYKLKDKANKFVDRRIGEKNRAMTADDRVIARFTASRVKAQKVYIFIYIVSYTFDYYLFIQYYFYL